jgi:hypothetical protein
MGYNRSKVRTFLTATVQFEWLLETYANLLIFRHVPWQTRYDELCEYRELHGKCWCHYCTCYCTCFDSLLCSSSISRPLYNPPPDRKLPRTNRPQGTSAVTNTNPTPLLCIFVNLCILPTGQCEIGKLGEHTTTGESCYLVAFFHTFSVCLDRVLTYLSCCCVLQEYKLMREGRSSRLSEERIQLLDAVKFVWEAQRGGPRKRSKKPNDDGSTSPSPKKKKSTSNEKPGKVTIPSYTEQARNLLRTQGLPGVPAYAATAPDAPTMPRIPPQGHQQRARSPPFAPGPSPFAPGPSHFAPRPSPFASVHPPTAFEPLAAVYAKIGAAASAKTATKVANAGAGNFYPRPAPIPVPGYGSESTNSATIYWPPPQHVASDREVADKVNSYEAGDAMLFQQVRQQAAQAQDQARAQHMAKAKSDKLADAKAQALAEAQEQDQDRALAQAQAQDQNRALAQAQAQAHARVHGHAHAQHAMMQQQAQAARQVAAQPQPITKQASYTTHQAHQSYPGTARRPAAGPPAPQHRYPIHGETGAQRVDGFSSNGQQPPRQRPSTGPPVAQHHYPVNGGTGAQRVNVFNSRQAPQQGQAAPKAPAQEQHPDDCFAAPAFIFNVPAKAIQSPASPKTPTKVKPPASPKANFQSQAAVKEELPVPASNEDESGIFDDADDDIY